MARYGVVGAGYVGLRLVRHWVFSGHTVRASRRSDDRFLDKLGAEPFVLSSQSPDQWEAFCDGLDGLVYLAPPDKTRTAAKEVAVFAPFVAGKPFVYGSTTGAFGNQPDGVWDDEDTKPGPLMALGQRRADFEQALTEAGLSPRIVRIAGIYGPGRTLEKKLGPRGLTLYEGGGDVSRIHVADLARILDGMLTKPPAPMVIAADGHPAPTLEVARYTADLCGIDDLRVLSLDEAMAELTAKGRELRTGGRRCGSKYLSALIGELEFKSYVSGVAASLSASA